MTAKQGEPDEFAVLSLDDLAELEDLEEDDAGSVLETAAARKLSTMVARIQWPAYLASTRRLTDIVARTQSPAFLASTRELSDIVAGTQSPAFSAFKSLTETVAAQQDLLKPRFALAEAIGKSTAERAAFSVTSGLKVSDSVTDMINKLVKETGGLGPSARSDMSLGLTAGSSVLKSFARAGQPAKGLSATTLGFTATSTLKGSLASLGLTGPPLKIDGLAAAASDSAGFSATSDSIRRITEGLFASDIGRTRSLATRHLVATSGIADLIAGDKMMASWRQSLLSEATARSLIGTIKLPDGNANLLRDIVGINSATARVVSLYAEQNKFRMLAPALSARPTRELRGFLAGLPLTPDVDDLTLAVHASRGVAGIAAADLLASPGVIDPAAEDLLNEEVVDPWLNGPQTGRTILLARLGALDESVPDLLRGAWEQVEQNGPASVSLAAHACVEVVDRTLRAVAPEEAVLEWHAATGRPDKELYDKNGKPAATRALRIAYALHQRRSDEAKLIAAQVKAISGTVTFLQETLQAGKHASKGTIGLIRTHLVSVEATLTQLLYEPGDD